MSLPEWLVVAGMAETGGAFELIQETRAIEGDGHHVLREREKGFWCSTVRRPSFGCGATVSAPPGTPCRPACLERA